MGGEADGDGTTGWVMVDNQWAGSAVRATGGCRRVGRERERVGEGGPRRRRSDTGKRKVEAGWMEAWDGMPTRKARGGVRAERRDRGRWRRPQR